MRKKGVQDEIYLAASDLIGIGLSINEALLAIEIVSNRCFGRSFKRLKKTVARSRCEIWWKESRLQVFTPSQWKIESKEGTTNTITHAADSTTKKSVGKFAFSGDPL